jgi:hypothetical protein
MMKLIDVGPRVRAILMVNGKPRRYLRPGRYLVLRPFARVELVWLTALVADLDAEQLALVPAEDLQIVRLAESERAVVWRRGRPALWLGPGEHQVVTIERSIEARDGKAQEVPAVRIERIDVSGVETSPLRDDVKAIVPAADYVEATAAEGCVVVRYVDGALDAVLPAGRRAAWTAVRKVQLAVIDTRERLLQIPGQEVMSKDRVTLRLNLAADYRVADARRLASVARAPDEILYLAVQLASRDAVAVRSLDELLAAREALAEEVAREVAARTQALGLELLRFGIKDLILPGEMKALLNRVIEAQKESEANVILRREETAATRSMAQTAKVLAENPLLVRLKELEAYKELAGKVGRLHVVLGEGSLPSLKLGAG